MCTVLLKYTVVSLQDYCYIKKFDGKSTFRSSSFVLGTVHIQMHTCWRFNGHKIGLWTITAKFLLQVPLSGKYCVDKGNSQILVGG